MHFDDVTLDDLDCAKVRRKEKHPAHQWEVQLSDDSPYREYVWCEGYRG
jgi:hypothetical protein